MHATAMENADRFFRTYRIEGAQVVDIGAQDVNGSLRSVCPYAAYTGVDFVAGEGVDLVLTDPYQLPLPDESADIVVCSSCFEHSEFFWLLFMEIMRVLKPHGLLYLNAPSNGDFHRYPVDCWRFYPDAGEALARWGRRNGLSCQLLESYISNRRDACFNDFIAVIVKEGATADRYPDRVTSTFGDYRNGSDGTKATVWTEDQSTVIWDFRRYFWFRKATGATLNPFAIFWDLAMRRVRRPIPTRFVDPEQI